MYLLLNEARSSAIARLFGISGENSALVTMIALGLAAGTVHRKAVQIIHAPGGPTVADGAIGAALLGESAHGIAGGLYRGSPLFGTLIATSLVGAALRPVVRTTLRGVKASSHAARADFDHRYGHIIRRSRRQR